MCYGFRLPFNFKRKHRNCYNCGVVVFCHSCSRRRGSIKQGSLEDDKLNSLKKVEICPSSKKNSSRVSPLIPNGGLQEVIKLREKVEILTLKAQLQEVELERTKNLLKEAIAIAGEKTAKCNEAKDVIKSLTSQLKDMAERLPVRAARNIKSPSLASFGSSPASNEVSNAFIDRMNGQATFQEPDSNGSNSQLLSNGSSTNSNRSSGHNKKPNSDAMSRNGNRIKERESRNETEWVEQDEPGVYITLTLLPGGVKDLKRVRFSRKRFCEKQAEQWWADNRSRVYEQYNLRMIDKSSIGVGSEDVMNSDEPAEQDQQ